ncbi:MULTISPECIES: energy-coupling factor transporter transmembrane component T family protein [Clostridium]|uniref:energy-coupling factor transporter transmembrane component T family protein n=1 Tax=Clostridium TaxID=1485 RepID=UPI00189A438C|nr:MULTISPECIES: energy-coupling factor transporter transmembrane component T [Clostridium]MDI9215573.1 energy-coupling factor transporter transmembrane protein EcfT [Clostridium tertium]
MEQRDWLLKKDNYEPVEDNENFLDKTIVGIMTMLSKIKRENPIDGFIYRINPIVQLISMIVLILFLALSNDIFFVYCILAYSLMYICILDGYVIKKILSISLIPPIFTLIILLPSIVFMGNYQASMLLVLKIFINVLLINIFSYTTKWSNITKSLKVLFIPDIVILIFDITIKYIYVLGNLSLKMLYALKLKTIGKSLEKRNSLLRIIGNLFLKSKTMGDQLYLAMECRGFTGEYIVYSKFKFTLADAIYTFITIIMIVIFFVV